MIFVPLISRTGNVFYYAGFPQEQHWMLLISGGIIFLVKDVLEWYFITFKFMLFSESRVEQLVPVLLEKTCSTNFDYRHLRSDGIAQAVLMGVLGLTAYFCALMYALRWNPYNKLEIQTVTGYRDLEWEEVYGFCKERGGA